MAFTETTNGGRRAVYAAIITTALSFLVILLRFVSKIFKSNVSIDDWLIVVAFSVHIISASIVIWGELSLFTDPIIYRKSLFLGSVFYPILTTAIKASLLALYHRIFITSTFRRAVFIIGAIAMSWGLAVALVSAMTCIPEDKFWIPTKPGRCINFNNFALSYGILEIIIDSAIFILPIPMISGLKLRLGAKVGLMVIFLLGGFVIITGIIRVKSSYVIDSTTGYVNFDEIEFWSLIHSCTGMISASFPVYRLGLLVSWASGLGSSIRKRYGSYGSSTKISRSEYNEGTPKEAGRSREPRDNNYINLGDVSNDCVHLTQVDGGKGDVTDEYMVSKYAAGVVMVARTVDVV